MADNLQAMFSNMFLEWTLSHLGGKGGCSPRAIWLDAGSVDCLARNTRKPLSEPTLIQITYAIYRTNGPQWVKVTLVEAKPILYKVYTTHGLYMYLACDEELSDVFPSMNSKSMLYLLGGMMTSSNGNIFRVTGPLCGEFTGDRWIPLTKASDAELWCFTLICDWTHGWVNNWGAGDLRRHCAHYDVTVMVCSRGVL